MASPDIPPSFDAEFLDWFKTGTEAAWADYAPRDFKAAGVGGLDWQPGTRWTGGLQEAQIAAAEKRWSLEFPPDHRLFLKRLHTVDRPMKGMGFIDDKDMAPREKLQPYDWTGDPASLQEALDWPWEGLVFDLEHNPGVWPEDAWGPMPAALEERKRKAAVFYGKAPKLIPVIGHRYLVAEPCRSDNPVLSVYQTDIIVYGPDLRWFLLIEFARLLGLDEDELWRAAPKARLESIPHWGLAFRA